MKIVVLDGYTENPGDLSWAGLEALGEVTVYDRTSYVEDPIIAELVITHFSRLLQTLFEFLPLLIASRFVVAVVISSNIRSRADLAGYIPMPDHILDRDFVLLHKLYAQPDRVLYDLIFKVPVLVIRIDRRLIDFGRTHLNANRVVVAAIRMRPCGAASRSG